MNHIDVLYQLTGILQWTAELGGWYESPDHNRAHIDDNQGYLTVTVDDVVLFMGHMDNVRTVEV